MPDAPPPARDWLPFALLAALFAAVTAVLQKLGVADVNGAFATLVRTAVVLLAALAVVAARGDWEPAAKLAGRGGVLLALSGLATGASWVCYLEALKRGPASRVGPVDKLSVVLVVLFAVLVLGEAASWRVWLGAGLVLAGVVLVARG